MILRGKDIVDLEQEYRRNLINSLSGFKSVNLVGTINSKGQTNLAIMSQIFHLGADPALMGLIIRPASVPRHSYENILETRYYTFNHIHSEILKQAHQTSARYEREQSEFEATDLIPEFSNYLPAPYVSQSKIKIGLEFKEEHLLKINNTILIIGEVIEIILPEECVAKDGLIDLFKAGSITSTGLDSYFSTKKEKRFTYAKANKQLDELEF